MSQSKIPGWVNYGLIPGINVVLAFAVSALVILTTGESLANVFDWMMFGAFGTQEGIGYTLYYTTSFIFTGLAVAMAFHAGLFNIGGEGQAYIGGLGVGIICLTFGNALPFWLLLPLSIAAGAVFGAAWAFIPAYLQAKRGSHIVITTIMFNFIAASLMVYMLNYVLKPEGEWAPVSAIIPDAATMPRIHEILGVFGIAFDSSPLNLSFVWALICCVLFYFFIWHTRWGYEIRAVGANSTAAVYGGVKPAKVVILAMLISGALAGFLGLNEIQGFQHQLRLDFVAGAGFTGIAVALMGRNHPVGIVVASLLFGVLYQGGGEISFESEKIDREIVAVVQGLVILFCGALEHMFKPQIEAFFLRRELKAKAAAQGQGTEADQAAEA